MCLSRPCLTICQNGRVVSLEASKDQIAGTCVEDVLLCGIRLEDTVKPKLFLTDLESLIVLLLLNAYTSITISQFAANQWPYSHRHLDGAILSTNTISNSR